jgi:hypothetical protein
MRAWVPLIAVGVFAAAAPAAHANSGDPNMVATFYDMSDAKFSIKAIAPPDAWRQYAIRKAVWYAEKNRSHKFR